MEVRDARGGNVVVPVPEWARKQEAISTSGDVESLLDGTPDLDFTIGVVAHQGCKEIERCVSSVPRWLGTQRAETLVVDNGFDDDCVQHLDRAP